MEDNIHTDELQHWGIKGMRWGVRRYQNADGSLTPRGLKRYSDDGGLSKKGQKQYAKEVDKLKKETAKVKAAEKEAANQKKAKSKFDALAAKKQALEERKKALEDSKKKKDDDQPEETIEQKRERLLKSSDPKEIYEGRDALTYQELNDRVSRIDLETRLQNKIPIEEEKHISDIITEKLDKATSVYKSVDNAYSTVKNSAIGKTLAKSLGIETETKKRFDLHEFVKNIDYKSTQEVLDARKRHQADQYLRDEEAKIRNKEKADADYRKKQEQAEKEAKATEARKKEAEKQAKKEAKKQAKEDSKSKKQAANESKKEEGPEHVETDGRVYGEGTSRYTGFNTKKETVIDAEEGVHYRSVGKDRVDKAVDALKEAEKNSSTAIVPYGKSNAEYKKQVENMIDRYGQFYLPG